MFSPHSYAVSYKSHSVINCKLNNNQITSFLYYNMEYYSHMHILMTLFTTTKYKILKCNKRVAMV